MLNVQKIATEQDSPLALFSQKTFRLRYKELQSALPGVKHHYALKALPYKGCIVALLQCGGYLDVASIGEIQMVKEFAPEMLSRCIYTHPVKTRRDIESALESGVSVMVADNRWELEKLLPYTDRVQLLVRVAFPNPDARCDLSSKFGAPLSEAKSLLRYCQEQGICLLGCSFHVGSQMLHPAAHTRAIETIREIYDWHLEQFGQEMPVLNIGGGFPARLDESIPTITDFCRPIRERLNALFPNTEIWSEPGRCLASDSMAAVSKVIGKTVKNRKFWYYLNDGVYNTFSGKIYDHAEYKHELLTPRNRAEMFQSVLAGPTCDSIDVLNDRALLPELEIGDLFLTRQVGAYGWASRSDFNLLPQTSILEVGEDLMPPNSASATGKHWPSSWDFYISGNGGIQEMGVSAQQLNNCPLP